MLGSRTTPARTTARDDVAVRVAFQGEDPVGDQKFFAFAAQWPACTIPCRRFALHLAEQHARLGGGVTRYVFTVEDLHLLLLAGLPAHIAVGTPITERPPHRTVRAEFPHTAPTLGV